MGENRDIVPYCQYEFNWYRLWSFHGSLWDQVDSLIETGSVCAPRNISLNYLHWSKFRACVCVWFWFWHFTSNPMLLGGRFENRGGWLKQEQISYLSLQHSLTPYSSNVWRMAKDPWRQFPTKNGYLFRRFSTPDRHS